jgi:two-component sensor histidine kinase
VTERITSLAKTHTLLIETNHDGASLRDILMSELEPYDDGTHHRVRLKGPEVICLPTLQWPLAWRCMN